MHDPCRDSEGREWRHALWHHLLCRKNTTHFKCSRITRVRRTNISSLSLCLSLCLSVSLSLCLSIYMYVCISVCLTTCLSHSVSLCVCLSVSLYVEIMILCGLNNSEDLHSLLTFCQVHCLIFEFLLWSFSAGLVCSCRLSSAHLR